MINNRWEARMFNENKHNEMHGVNPYELTFDFYFCCPSVL